jgi:5-methylcytosine-specific restriction endonuclease McrA
MKGKTAIMTILGIPLCRSDLSNYKCILCGDPDDGTLIVHRIDGNPRNISPDNLLSLHERCHRKIEMKLTKKMPS